MWRWAKVMLWGDSEKARGRVHVALSPLCSHGLDSLVSLLGQSGAGGRRILLKSALVLSGCRDSHPCLGLGAGTPATLHLSCLYIRPFSLDPALTGVWTQKNPPNPRLTFPTCEISRSPGGMSRSLLDLPWDWQSCCSPTWDNPGAPQTSRAVCSALCASSRSLRSQGPGRRLSVWEAPRGGKHRPPPNCSSCTPRSFTPTGVAGTSQHQSVQRWVPPPQFSSLQLAAGAGPSASPGASPRQPRALPPFSALPSPGATSLRGKHIFTLSVFSFPNGVAGARCPATYRF